MKGSCRITFKLEYKKKNEIFWEKSLKYTVHCKDVHSFYYFNSTTAIYDIYDSVMM